MNEYSFAIPMFSPFQGMFPSTLEHPKPLKGTNSIENGSDEESFQPDYHHMKKLGIKVNKSKIQTGGWSAAQNQIYLKFMIDNINDFISEKSRRTSKVFYRLSKILKRRTPDQCRSHHQKLQMRYQEDLNGIMGEVYRKIQHSLAEEFVNQQHRHFRPNFMCLKEEKKEEAPEDEKSVHEPEVKKEILNFGWYGMTIDGSCIRLEIKTENIQDYVPK